MKNMIIAALCLVLAPSLVFAQNTGKLVMMTADDAVKYALANSYSLKSSAIDLNIKERAADTAWNTFLPTVQITGTASRVNEYADQMGALMAAINPSYQPPKKKETDHWTLSAPAVSISWTFSAAMLESIKTAHVNYEAGQISWQQAQKETELNVRKLFYTLLMMQETYKITLATLENAKSRAAQAEANYRSGRGPELQLLQAQVTYENAIPDVLRAEQELKQNLATFAFLLGMTGTEIELIGEIEPEYFELDKNALIQSALQNYEFQSLRKNREVLDVNQKTLKLQAYTPFLQLSWDYQPMAGMTDLKNGVSSPWTDNGGLSFTLGINITNLLPWSSTQQQIKDLDANLQKMQLDINTLSESTKNDISAKVDSLALSRSQIDAMRRNITLAQRAYDSTLESYKSGTAELLTVRDSESALNQAKLALIREKYSYLTGIIDLEYAVNMKL
ncbi:TolC family protein [Breznakiellaceae bacterium SP9]